MKLTRYEIRNDDGFWTGALRGGHLNGVVTSDQANNSLSWWLKTPPEEVKESIRNDETITFWFTYIGDLKWRSTSLYARLVAAYGDRFRVRSVDLFDTELEEIWEDEHQVALSEVLPLLPSLENMPY